MTLSIEEVYHRFPYLCQHALLAPVLERHQHLSDHEIDHVQAILHELLLHSRELEEQRVYGEFLYLTHYLTHPEDTSPRVLIEKENQITQGVKEMACEQWSSTFPHGYAGAVWCHTPKEEERRQGIIHVWQVAVYASYEHALHHNIACRFLEVQEYYWYLEQVHILPRHCDSFIHEDRHGIFKVSENYGLDEQCQYVTQAPVSPHHHRSLRETTSEIDER